MGNTRSRTVDILRPIASGKDTEGVERTWPVQVELTNGRIGPNGAWKRRPGRRAFADLSSSAPVVGLVREAGPYAICEDGTVHRIRFDGHSDQLPGSVEIVGERPRWLTVAGEVLIVAGGRPASVDKDRVSELGYAAYPKAQAPTLTLRGTPGGIEEGEYDYMVQFVTNDGSTAPGTHATVRVGVPPPPTPEIELVEGLPSTLVAGTYRYALSYVTTIGETWLSAPTDPIAVDAQQAVKVTFAEVGSDIWSLVTGYHVWHERDGHWHLIGLAGTESGYLATKLGGYVEDGLSLVNGEVALLAGYGREMIRGEVEVGLPSPDPAFGDTNRLIAKELYRAPTGSRQWQLVERFEDLYRREYIDRKELGKLGQPAVEADQTESRPPRGSRFIAFLFDVVVVAGFDSYGFRWSSPGDVDHWPGSNYTETSLDGGANVGMELIGQELVIFKEFTTEIWARVGNAFVRRTIIRRGAAGGIVTAGGTVYFIGDDHEFYRLAGGMQLVPVDAKGFTDLRGAYGLDFTIEHCVRWLFPGDMRCVTFDYRSGLTYEDSAWSNGTKAFLGITAAADLDFDGEKKCYVGASNGMMDEWTDEVDDDKGTPIRSLRKLVVPCSGRGNKARIEKFAVRIQRGIGLDDRTPVLEVNWILDTDGTRYRRVIPLGDAGDLVPYEVFRNLGIAHQITLELIETDAVPYVLTNAFLTVKELGR